MIDKYAVGNRIALLRREKALTGEKFAEALGVSPQAVSKWENGKCLPETALLPAVAALLGTSIDSILIPQELVILDARYTCGDSYIVITDVLNRAVDGNKLKFKAEFPMGGHTAAGPEVFVLTVKYQTPDGTYFAFVPQGETLEIGLDSKGYTAKSKFEIVGAYYGTGGKYKSVMQKMTHYEYFKCGSPLDAHCYSRERDGSLNDQYCKWCYIDGEHKYHDMEQVIKDVVSHWKWGTPEQMSDWLRKKLVSLDYWKEKA